MLPAASTFVLYTLWAAVIMTSCDRGVNIYFNLCSPVLYQIKYTSLSISPTPCFASTFNALPPSTFASLNLKIQSCGSSLLRQGRPLI